MKKQSKHRTPSRAIADMIRCGMTLQGETIETIADKLNVSMATVCTDLQRPEKIQSGRMWLYFTILGLPVQDVLNGIADEVAKAMAETR